MKRGVSRFSVENILLHSTEKFRWGTLRCFREIGVSKNFMHYRGYHKFPSKTFCLTVPKNFVGIPSMFQKISGIEKFYASEKGGITFLRRKHFVTQYRKILWASLQCFRKIGVSKNFMHNRGHHKFPSKIFCLTVPSCIKKC